VTKRGYGFFIGPELEYFYFKDNKNPEFLDSGGYFDTRPLDVGSDLRRDTIFTLQSMGSRWSTATTRWPPASTKSICASTRGFRMADKTMTYRLVVKEIARQHGVYATFMPKPVFGQNGSGMHVHQSLFRGTGTPSTTPGTSTISRTLPSSTLPD